MGHREETDTFEIKIETLKEDLQICIFLLMREGYVRGVYNTFQQAYEQMIKFHLNMTGFEKEEDLIIRELYSLESTKCLKGRYRYEITNNRLKYSGEYEIVRLPIHFKTGTDIIKEINKISPETE